MRRLAPSLGEQFSRHDLVRSPHVWFALCATFGVFAISTAGLSFVMPDVNGAHVRVLSAILAAATVLFFASKAPEPNTVQAHLLLSAVYVGPALSIWAFAPGGTATVATAMFIGPLVSMWTTSRLHQLLHLIAATVVLFIPSALGVTDLATTVACMALVPAVWALSGCVSVILEACEEQGTNLARLIRRDPLTGIGNRRLLDESLADALADHTQAGDTFSVLTLDLNGFKRLNDAHGHAAGDDLLREVAAALSATADEHATVVRQGGDEFAVVLPHTTRAEADDVAAQIREELASITRGVNRGDVSSGIGRATFPADGDHPETLLHVADERLRADKARSARPALPSTGGTQRDERRPVAARQTTLKVASVAPPRRGRRQSALGDGIGRMELQFNPLVWRAHASMYVIYGIMGLVITLRAPQLVGPGFPLIVAFGAAVGIVYLLSGPPAIGTWANHAVVAMTYLIPTVILVLCQPGGGVAIGCLIFVGPLTATRLLSRWQIGAHLSAASCFLLALIPSGLVDAPTMVSILILVSAMWVLGICCVIVLEAAEQQTERLRELVGRDPLTGVGNRRALDDLLARELPHRSTRHPLSIITLDLNGFKALNDSVGHAAGDALLIDAAAALTRETRPSETIVRQGGDEFCVVLPETPSGDLADRIAGFRAALATVDCGGQPLTTGAGFATAPTDAITSAGLLQTADERLLVDKRQASARRGAPRRAAA